MSGLSLSQLLHSRSNPPPLLPTAPQQSSESLPTGNGCAGRGSGPSLQPAPPYLPPPQGGA